MTSHDQLRRLTSMVGDIQREGPADGFATLDKLMLHWIGE